MTEKRRMQKLMRTTMKKCVDEENKKEKKGRLE